MTKLNHPNALVNLEVLHGIYTVWDQCKSSSIF